ncbi:transcription antitermination factor NusB [Maridesulfovibrio ferrireducens]|uniref:Transcription antitermination protein NusB n=1 Tax=Maridesulfovibrio ferrireducens TaxID=246191 RepID=A0A1G9B013_9BACT|nr:transcription antitermination factor NusB [Maridesulfovibrio ferrireducens]MBI9109691.1 transcription antitermination factor NusB [Maridesulfovibrio ferrireducens]SDK32847.1 NusB antitermination factor [Maridesulfovibrio ferrireducens]
MSQTKGLRRKGRILAFQVLYGISFVPPHGGWTCERIYNQSPAVTRETDEDLILYARELLLNVWNTLEELDEIISKYSKHWKIERIAKAELAILRLSVYELLYKADIPLKVGINEGIELAKKFGDDNSRNFINGILDAVARDIDSGKFSVTKKF